MPFFLVYVSSATSLFSRQEIDEILALSHQNNTRLDVSGILLYKDGNLMQLLEGDEEVVEALYAKISADPRHGGLIRMWDGTEDERQFPDWSMAFRDLNGPDAFGTPGYSDFLTTAPTGKGLTMDVTHCRQLLDLFRVSM
jgi:Sensors of blue-light using FAD